eukprot:3941843-Rhodomonas_salina.1
MSALPFNDTRAALQSRGIEISDYHVRLLMQLQARCTAEGVGVEYLLLLLIAPARLIEAHRILPQKLARVLLAELQGTSALAGDALQAAFARDLSLYVRALSTVPGFGDGLLLCAPDTGCLVDVLRGDAPLALGQSREGFLAYLVDRLHASHLLDPRDAVQINFRVAPALDSAAQGVLTFSVQALSTAMAQAAVTATLRRTARRWLFHKARDASATVPEAEWLHCTSMASLRGVWEGVFAEDESPTPVVEVGPPGPVSSLVLPSSSGALAPAAAGPCPIRAYGEAIESVTARWLE